MPFLPKCPACGSALTISEEHAGKHVACGCGAQIPVADAGNPSGADQAKPDKSRAVPWWVMLFFGGLGVGLYKSAQFVKEAPTYAAVDESAAAQLGSAAARHRSYHQRVFAAGAFFTVLGLLLGILGNIAIIASLAPTDMKSGEDQAYFVAMMVCVPVFATVLGALFGVAIACLFAPTEFLTGPIGQRWMKVIGTKSASSARVVCALVTLILAAIPTAALILWLVYAGNGHMTTAAAQVPAETASSVAKTVASPSSSAAAEDIAVIGVKGHLALYGDPELKTETESGALEPGTVVTIKTGRNDVLEVSTPDGQTGWLRRCWVCSSQEMERRKRAGEIPDNVVCVKAEADHFNGRRQGEGPGS